MNPLVAPMVTEVSRAVTVEKSAELLINGFAAAQQAAIDKALANGASADELKPLTDLQAALVAEDDALAAAVLANTPAAPTP